MGWVEHFQKDHRATELLLAKLEGNLREIAHSGRVRQGILLECRELLEIVEQVIRPHFAREEEHIYPAVAATGQAGKEFAAEMLAEHQALFDAFNKFASAVTAEVPAELLSAGEVILKFLKDHIVKEDTQIPALLRDKAEPRA